MADLLDMDYINSLPQPFLGRTRGGNWWPIHDIEVQTGLVRIDVCGKLEVKHIGDFAAFRDDTGVERSSEAFYADANEEERAPIGGVAGTQVALKVEDAGNGWKRQTAIVDGVKVPDGGQQ